MTSSKRKRSLRVNSPSGFFKKIHGQVTVWIILGIVLLLLTTFLYQRGTFSQRQVAGFAQVGQQWDVPSVSSLVQACLDKVAIESLFYFGMVGDSRSPNDFFTGRYFTYDDQFKIPYYFMDGQSIMPSQADASKIIARYVDENIQKCTAGFKSVKGFQVKESAPKTIARINERAVDFSITYPIQVIRGDQKTVIDEWSFKQPSRLFQILNIAQVVVDREVQDNRFVHWDLLVDVTRQGYNMTSHAEEDNTIIYRIVDPTSLLYFEPFVFQFANKVRVA